MNESYLNLNYTKTNIIIVNKTKETNYYKTKEK